MLDEGSDIGGVFWASYRSAKRSSSTSSGSAMVSKRGRVKCDAGGGGREKNSQMGFEGGREGGRGCKGWERWELMNRERERERRGGEKERRGGGEVEEVPFLPV